MCGRFALKESPAELIARFELDECTVFMPRYNIPPGTDIPVIRQSPDGKRVLHLLRWGLVPRWAKDNSIGARLTNARGETMATKPSFRDAFKRRRCLVPASGFYEWKTEDKIKQPFYISLRSGELMALAGLWESWKAPDGSIVRTVCIVTTSAGALMETIHDRTPVIISPEHWQNWLAEPVEKVVKLVAPCPDANLQAWAVSRRVNKTVDDDPDLIERVEPHRIDTRGKETQI